MRTGRHGTHQQPKAKKKKRKTRRRRSCSLRSPFVHVFFWSSGFTRAVGPVSSLGPASLCLARLIRLFLLLLACCCCYVCSNKRPPLARTPLAPPRASFSSLLSARTNSYCPPLSLLVLRTRRGCGRSRHFAVIDFWKTPACSLPSFLPGGGVTRPPVTALPSSLPLSSASSSSFTPQSVATKFPPPRPLLPPPSPFCVGEKARPKEDEKGTQARGVEAPKGLSRRLLLLDRHQRGWNNLRTYIQTCSYYCLASQDESGFGGGALHPFPPPLVFQSMMQITGARRE